MQVQLLKRYVFPISPIKNSLPFKLNKEPSSKQHTLYSQTLLAEPNTTKSWNNPFHTGTQKPQNPLGQIFRTTRRRQLEALPDDLKKNQISNPQAQLIVDPDIRQYITIPMMMVITSSNEITGGQIFRTTRRRQLQALPDDPKPQISNLQAQLIAGPDLRQYTTIPMIIVITSSNVIRMTRRRNGVRAPGWMKRFGRVGAKLTNISRK